MRFDRQFTVADPGFPVGGRGPRRGGAWTPEVATVIKFVCQNERIGSLRGGAPGAAPLNPPMVMFMGLETGRGCFCCPCVRFTVQLKEASGN